MDTGHGRRRVDRIVSPDYLHAIEERSPAELRALRDECRGEEEELSYARRVLQAQLDIARSEAARRAGDTGDAALVSQLPGILADPPSDTRRAARAVGFHVPTRSGQRAGDLDAPQAALSRLPDLSDAELADLIGRLGEQEQRVSQQRRIVLDRVDQLQAELVRRYRDGGLTVDDVVSGVARGGEDSDAT
jgi:hypothetical protein